MSWPPQDSPRGRGEVRLEREGSLARMTLHNPGARNAMSLAMMADFVGAVDRLTVDPPVALIVTGGGDGGFCAGGDLRDVRAHLLKDGSAEAMSTRMGEATARLAQGPFVIVAAVEGAALGGGAELTQMADWVVMATSAKIGFVHARLGVSPGWGGAHLLTQRVGRAAAMTTLLRGEIHRLDAALALGLADQDAAPGTALETAEAWLAPILSAPPEAIRGAIQILRSVPRGVPEQTERSVFCSLWGGDAHRAALARTEAGK